MTADPFQQALRGSPSSWLVALGSGVAAAAAFVGLQWTLTVTMRFWGVTANWLAPLLVVAIVPAAVRLSRSRTAGALAAGALTATIVLVIFVAAGWPYVRASLGLSPLVGRAILVLVPALAAAILALAGAPAPARDLD